MGKLNKGKPAKKFIGRPILEKMNRTSLNKKYQESISVSNFGYQDSKYMSIEDIEMNVELKVGRWV